MKRRNFNEPRVCSRCGRTGTHQFSKDERGHDICSNFTACKRRYMTATLWGYARYVDA